MKIKKNKMNESTSLNISFETGLTLAYENFLVDDKILSQSLGVRMHFKKLYFLLGLDDTVSRYTFTSILKKIKSRFFKNIHLALKKCLKRPLLIKRIPQTYIRCINKKLNASHLTKNLNELFKINKLSLYCQQIKIESQIHRRKRRFIERIIKFSS